MADGFYESGLEKLRQRGHQSKKVARVHTGERAGATILSRNVDESAIEPSFLILKTVEEAKELGGFPDSDFEDGKLDDDLLAIPQNFSREITPDPQPYSDQICSALRAYIFGYSHLVRTYKDILNSLRFPTTLTIHEAEEIIVSKGKPLIVKDDGHGSPMALLVKKVTVEPGGQILWQGATGTMIAQELTYQMPTAGVSLAALLADGEVDGQNFVSIGTLGGKGEDGASPDPGAKGGDGNPGKDNKNSCAQKATDGSDGKPGPDGGDGQDGGKGGDGNEINVTVDVLNGTVYVGSGGGDGGPGGKGGNGATGGRGGNGGDASSHCGAGQGKKGGNGGKAGNGGKGGNGGNGRNVYITYKSGSPTFTLKAATGAGGTGGKAGTPGTGGIAGTNGGTPGDSGGTGKSGDTGDNGSPGQVFINGKALIPS